MSSASKNVWNHPTSSSSFLSTNSSTSSTSFFAIKDECLNYFESTEIEYFVRTLISEIITRSPEDPIMYAAQFFRKVRLCQHVVSRDLKFIRESQYNRISFVVCVKNAFSGFTAGVVPSETGGVKEGKSEMTIFELSTFVSLLFEGISVHFVELFAAVLEPSQRNESNISLSRFYLSHLLSALYFTVVYECWLNELSGFCEVKNGRKVVDLRNVLVWIDTPAYYSTKGPDKALFSKFIEEVINSRKAKGDSEISFKRLKRYMFLNETLQNEIMDKLPKEAVWKAEEPPIDSTYPDLESTVEIPASSYEDEESSNAIEGADSVQVDSNFHISAPDPSQTE